MDDKVLEWKEQIGNGAMEAMGAIDDDTIGSLTTLAVQVAAVARQLQDRDMTAAHILTTLSGFVIQVALDAFDAAD